MKKELNDDNDILSDVSESLDNSSQLSVVDEDDEESDLARLKSEISHQMHLLHYDLRDMNYFKRTAQMLLERESCNLLK